MSEVKLSLGPTLKEKEKKIAELTIVCQQLSEKLDITK